MKFETLKILVENIIGNQMVPRNSRLSANWETFFTNMYINQNNNTENDKNS